MANKLAGKKAGKKKSHKKICKKTYDEKNSRPVLKCSICNGEQVAGFKDIRTGKFEEIMLIRGEKDLQEFMDTYGIKTISKEY
ncbi:MAG: aspartate dehydrogenase [Clostridium sp.]|nr:aspartate dehydrogenase [Clostridium sp.]